MADPDENDPGPGPGVEAQLARYGQVLRDHTARSSVEPSGTFGGPAIEIPLGASQRGPGRRRVLTGAGALVAIAITVGLAVVALHPTGTRVETASTSATTPAPSPTHPALTGVDPHQLAAQTAAAALANRMQIDPAWTSVASLPVLALTQAPTAPATTDLARISRLWASPDSWTDTDAWIAAHPPTGLAVAGSGSFGDRSETTSRTTGFAPPPLPPTNDDYHVILITTAPLPGGGTGIRMDVQVTWVPSRPATALVPDGETAVLVTAGWDPGQPGDQLSRTFHDRATIEALRRTVNSLAMAQPGPMVNCPAMDGLTYTLSFIGGAAKANVTSVPCPGTTLTLGGAPPVELENGPTLLDQEARLLGTTDAALEARARQAHTVTPTTG